MGAMGPPGGGRSFISQRLQSKFNLVNMTFPQESQIKRIFGTLITQKLATFSEDVKPLGTSAYVRKAVCIFLYTATVMIPHFYMPNLTRVDTRVEDISYAILIDVVISVI